MEKKPKLIAFDLDYTLWPFLVDRHVTPPFIKNSRGHIIDSCGSKIECYPEVPTILKYLDDENYSLAVTSRTGEVKGAFQLIDLLGWNIYFSYKEIYPCSKVKHFYQLNKQSGIDFKDMLFFDDKERNIRDVKNIGVVSVLVNQGVNMKVVEEGLREYARQQRQ